MIYDLCALQPRSHRNAVPDVCPVVSLNLRGPAVAGCTLFETTIIDVPIVKTFNNLDLCVPRSSVDGAI